nr:gliding motility-associated C-terminal domain-containing protein [uncultured Arsenicibacter sp.]
MSTKTTLNYILGLIIWLGILPGINGALAQLTGPPQNVTVLQSFSITAQGSLCSPTANTACGSGAVTFTDSRTDVTAWSWQFGPSTPGSGTTTPGSGTGVTATTRTVTHQFSGVGEQTFILTRTLANGTTLNSTIPITVGQSPQSFTKWRTDTTICKGETLTLDPYQGASQPDYTYKWAPKGQTTQTLSVTESGCYSVEVKSDGCPYEDLIHVDVCFEPPGSPSAKWYFGSNAGLDFAGGSPQPLTDGKLKTLEGASSISNSKGQLQFYTDGIYIYDADGNIMATAPGTASALLGGDQKSTQSALIVPKPTCRGCEYLYYVYTTAEVNGTKQLTYSIVDMRENGGKGAITAVNLPVSSDPTKLSTERSAAVQNEADTTYWVVTHDFGSDVFRITHLTRSGTPTQTTVSAGASQTNVAQAQGYMKFGPAISTSATGGTATPGASNTAIKQLAVVVPGVVPGPPNNMVELYEFDTQTGDLTYKRTIDLGPAPPDAYGVEFSPDGTKLFVTLLGNPSSATNASSYLVQYDLKQTDPDALTASRTEIATSTTQQFGALQVATDGKIYVSVPGSTSLGVIENPNATFLDSLRFNINGQDLGGRQAQLGLPNQVMNFTQPPSSSPGLSHEGECVGDTIQFTIGPFCQKLKETYTLNFGDGTVPKSFTSAQVQKHIYKTPGSYTATLTIRTENATGGLCNFTTVTDALTIVAVPQAFSLGPDQDICQTSLDLTIPVEASNYAWVRNGRIISRNKTYTITQTGQYTAYAFNSPDCYEADQIYIILRRPPDPRVTPSSTVCAGTSTTVGVGTPIYEQFKWSTGEGSKVITVQQGGVYSVTATYNNPTGGVCTATGSVTLTALPKPRLTAALTPPTGCTTLDGAITLTPTPAGTYTYVWTRADGSVLPSTTNLLSAVSEGTYKVKATNAAQCTVDSSFALVSPANPLKATPTSMSALCSVPNSGSANLTITGGTPTVFVWRDATGAIVSQTQPFTGAAAGRYNVEISDAGGCRLNIPIVDIGLDTRGFADLPPLSQACIGEVLSLTPAGANVPGNTFTWSTGETTPTISVSAPGSYSITIRNTLNGCIGSDFTNVTFSPKPTVSAGPALSVCVGVQPVQLTGNSPTGGVWSGTGVTPAGSFTPSAAYVSTIITVTYSVTQNGCANAATRAVSVLPPPQVNAGPDVEFCANQPQSLSATGTSGASFQWSNGTAGAILRPVSSGTYVVTASQNGCSVTDAVVVRVKPVPQFSFTKEAAICVGDGQSTTLLVRGTPDLTYSWPDVGSSLSAITVNRSGSYSLIVTNTDNCVVRDFANVRDLCEARVFIPEAFTPNGDSQNDVLQVFSAYTTDFELKIFNRWGEIVFMTTNPAEPWDGLYKGVSYPPQVYAYVVTYGSQYFPERPRVTKRGSVSVIR